MDSGSKEKLWIVRIKLVDGREVNVYPSAANEEEARQKAVRFCTVAPEISSVQRFN